MRIKIIKFVVKALGYEWSGDEEWEYVGLYGLSYLTLEMTLFYLHESVWGKFGNKVK